MLDSPVYCIDKASVSETLVILRTMAKDAIAPENSPNSDMNDLLLRKIFNLFEKVATNKSPVCRESIDVSAELFSLLKTCQSKDPGPSEAELSFVNLLAHHGTPEYVLQTLALWAYDYPSSAHLMPLLHILLQRGTHHGITREISGSLLRVRYARAQSQGTREIDVSSDTHVWRSMFDGSVAIAK